MEFVALFHLLSALASSLLVLSHSSYHESADVLSSCLIDHKVYNFSLQDRDSSLFYKLLDASIQNLRFQGPSVPKPAAIIIPESKEQLISSVLCFRRGSWVIRVRSGGHSYEGTSYVAYDGSPFVVIDVVSLDRISVDLESETDWVEAGATLGQTYYAISESSNVHGFPAGACPTVGIGGHISGGGFGSLFRKYGLAADNVVDALLVDVNGRSLDRESMGEEVFWAIRGGGGGVWGVLLAGKIRLVKVPQVLTGFTVSRHGSKTSVAELLDKWQNAAPKLVDEFYLSLVIGAGLLDAEPPRLSATFKGLYLGPRHVALSILDEAFPELGILEGDCKEMSWIESVLYFSGLKNRSSISELNNRYLHDRVSYKAKSDYVRTAMSRTGVASAIDILEKEPKGFIILDPYDEAMTKISSDALPYPHRKGNLFMIQYVIEWRGGKSAESEGNLDWMRGFYAAMAPHVSFGPRAAYINYMDIDIGVMNSSTATPADAVERARMWGEKYFLKNYDRLVRVKTLIDPLNVFRHEQGIFPADAAKGRAEV